MFHFSRQVPDGNYRVTLRLCGRDSSADCTVWADPRRLMVEAFALSSAEVREVSFIVNVRTPGCPLTLDVPKCGALVKGVTVEPVHVPTVYLVGDSTVADEWPGPGASWGQMLPRFFNPDVAIANHARSGATLKSFLAELRLDKVLSRLARGDWLMIQFAHNDQKKEWPQTYVEASTTYRSYLRAYIAEARRSGAIPILVTSPERRNFDAHGQIVDSLGGYPDAVRDVAREDSVALIDLNAMSKAFYETLGPERAALAFRDDGRDKSHHSKYGAYELARMVVTGVRAADPILIGDLAGHLAPDAAAFDPRAPDPPESFDLLEEGGHVALRRWLAKAVSWICSLTSRRSRQSEVH